MAAGIANFFKSIIPGAKGLFAIGRGGWSAASNSFRAARAGGGGFRLAFSGGRTAALDSIRGSWTAASRIPGATTQMRNAGIAMAGGAGLLALNRGGAESRRT